jgi:quercetin dioxygenase-like cupin family protein
MFMPKTNRPVDNRVGRRPPRTLMVTGAFLACALGACATQTVRATPPSLFTATNIVGPVMLDDIHTVLETPGYGAMLKTRGQSDVYITRITIGPSGHGGWHSHPGPSIITVKSGTASFYDECDDFAQQLYAADTGFVEDAGCVHLLANEGMVDLEVVVIQIVPRGAPRRIDEPAPF